MLIFTQLLQIILNEASAKSLDSRPRRHLVRLAQLLVVSCLAWAGVQAVAIASCGGEGEKSSIKVTPASWNFTASGQKKKFVFENSGATSWTIKSTNFSFSGNQLSSSCTPGNSYSPGQKCEIEIEFKPAQPGSYTGTLSVTTNDLVQGQASLSGTA